MNSTSPVYPRLDFLYNLCRDCYRDVLDQMIFHEVIFVSYVWGMITNQFEPANLFQTICFLLIVMISLPSLMLDRLVSLFETHRRIKPKMLRQVEAVASGSRTTLLTPSEREACLQDYMALKFVQKRSQMADPRQLPTPQLTFVLHSGERITLYPAGNDIDITRTDKKGRSLVSYWVRGTQMRDRLDAMTAVDVREA